MKENEDRDFGLTPSAQCGGEPKALAPKQTGTAWIYEKGTSGLPLCTVGMRKYVLDAQTLEVLTATRKRELILLLD